jgi:signal transduction histidine kinase
MKLARKFALTVTCAILAVLAVNAVIDVRREIALFDAEARQDNHALGRAIAAAASTSWKVGGETEARGVIETASEDDEIAVRFVWLDRAPGTVDAPEVPREVLDPLGQGLETFVRWRRPRDDTESLYTYVPLSVPELPAAAIELRESLADEAAYVRRTVFQTVVATGTLVVLCGILVMALGVLLVGRPVRELVERARRIGAGHLSGRLRVSRRDELGELSAEMNAMSERLESAGRRLELETRERLSTLEQLRHADRLTTVGKLASGIAHELGTPLNVITGHAQLIAEDDGAGRGAHQNAAVISQQAQRVAAIIRQLLDFARRRTPQKATQDVVAIARQAVALLTPLAQKQGVALEVWSQAAELRGLVDPEQLKQALLNLVLNAIQSVQGGGRVWVRVDRARAKPPPEHGGPEGEHLCLEVADSGRGIPPDLMRRIFEPFVTTKNPGEGTGLGLSVEHRGWIDVESEMGRGSSFVVYLPLEANA